MSAAPLTAVLAGCGAMSRRWLESAALIDGLTITGLVDIDAGRAEARAAEFGLSGAATGADLCAVLKTVKPRLVFDVVVPGARAGVVKTAFAQGCDVLSEKPMAASLDEARELIALAKAAGRLHAVVQNRRYVEGIRKLRAYAQAGVIGEITSVHSDFFIAPHFGGFREEMENVLLLDMAIHTFDAARYIIGTMPSHVYCHEANPAGSWFRHGASAYGIFEFDGGVTYTYRGGWSAKGLRTSWESDWRINGVDGSLAWDGHSLFRAERETEASAVLWTPEPAALPDVKSGRTGGHEGVIRDFVEAVRAGSAPETVACENIKSLAMVFAAIESARLKRRVAVET